jgi:hypothetical protein
MKSGERSAPNQAMSSNMTGAHVLQQPDFVVFLVETGETRTPSETTANWLCNLLSPLHCLSPSYHENKIKTKELVIVR